MLDSPGLNDSVASIGLLDPSGGGPGEAFAQALAQGPRQLMYPKACISICRADDVGSSAEVLWMEDAPRKDRILRWGPLLRSQQQHVLMCAAQHLQSAQQQRGQRMNSFEETATKQQRELEELRAKLQQQEGYGRSAGGDSEPHKLSLQELQERGRRQFAESREIAMGCE